MKIEQFDKKSLAYFKKKIEQATQSVCEEFGVAIEFGNSRYTQSVATSKITFKVLGGGTVDDFAKKEFGNKARSFGVHESEYGKLFTYRNKQYKLVGCNPRSWKYPFVADCVTNGKKYRFSASAITQALDSAKMGQIGQIV
jgi:hypothetical protein